VLKGLFSPKTKAFKKHLRDMEIVEQFYKEGPVNLLSTVESWEEAHEIILEWAAFRKMGMHDYAETEDKT